MQHVHPAQAAPLDRFVLQAVNVPLVIAADTFLALAFLHAILLLLPHIHRPSHQPILKQT